MDVLHVFATVAREGSLSRAAHKLHLTQPAVSLQIKALQERLNLRLFERTPRGMRLTPDGAALLPLADRVLEAQREFAGAARRLHTQVRGVLTIGTILDPEFIRLGGIMEPRHPRNPAISPGFFIAGYESRATPSCSSRRTTQPAQPWCKHQYPSVVAIHVSTQH